MICNSSNDGMGFFIVILCVCVLQWSLFAHIIGQ